MRQGPKNSPRDSRPRPSPPKGVDPARAGIRALDCGEDAEPETTIIRRAAADDGPTTGRPDARPRDDQQQSS
jgi:hypothetical protein